MAEIITTAIAIEYQKIRAVLKQERGKGEEVTAISINYLCIPEFEKAERYNSKYATLGG